ncbi:hypothetical protein JG687_00017378 [Phytophthora cactorum]|uniref:Uncharacterized protein n=1 Tax=Phytophthora cactorum TaxID=29920 RepID=A0A329SVC8_9STRA|nr:hypothetical protein PC114_g15609 [Phytophthora cactorum]KAG2924636.1 hypothetical protein PC117_g15360 [Phytophthora cactorum]KAG3006180.1 hypothetical protein PC119_g15040 [Phytophthora cactorum]KAG3011059.1 hypothetical protein PC120_g14663 [Phytophthora cactorum]KAG3055195.1 hypothetical protein PC121_g15900 [Phytophthora cactorum]
MWRLVQQSRFVRAVRGFCERLTRNFGLKFPTLKNVKQLIERFSSTEEYGGLGAGFKD